MEREGGKREERGQKGVRDRKCKREERHRKGGMKERKEIWSKR